MHGANGKVWFGSDDQHLCIKLSSRIGIGSTCTDKQIGMAGESLQPLLATGETTEFTRQDQRDRCGTIRLAKIWDRLMQQLRCMSIDHTMEKKIIWRCL